MIEASQPPQTHKCKTDLARSTEQRSSRLIYDTTRFIEKKDSKSSSKSLLFKMSRRAVIFFAPNQLEYCESAVNTWGQDEAAGGSEQTFKRHVLTFDQANRHVSAAGYNTGPGLQATYPA